MEPTSKKTVRVIRELATMWKPHTVPAVTLRQFADWLEIWFEKTAWTGDTTGEQGP